jgi:hypothetical protein
MSGIKDLLYNIVTTWTTRRNVYDGNQWTLLPLLEGSFQVYVFVVATAYVKPVYRILLSLVIWGYFWCASDCEYSCTHRL